MGMISLHKSNLHRIHPASAMSGPKHQARLLADLICPLSAARCAATEAARGTVHATSATAAAKTAASAASTGSIHRHFHASAATPPPPQQVLLLPAPP